jgi:hypothetical protein
MIKQSALRAAVNYHQLCVTLSMHLARYSAWAANVGETAIFYRTYRWYSSLIRWSIRDFHRKKEKAFVI